MVSDLSHVAATAAPQDLARIAANGRGTSPADLLRHAAGDGIFRLPQDEDMLSAVLLAAALPDDDFSAFTAATALLLLDRLRMGGGRDDLYWNWDAFADHYRLAPDAVRAAIMGGFRALQHARGLYLSHPPAARDCLSDPGFVARIQISATDAGHLWQERAARRQPLTAEERGLFRYLVEREVGMAPPDPSDCPPVPPPLA